MDNCIFSIYVNDLQISRDFYCELFDLKPEIDLDKTIPLPNPQQFVEFHFNDWVLCIRSLKQYNNLFENNENNMELSFSKATITRTELFFYVENNRNEMITRLEKAGGKILFRKKERTTDQWIETTAYGTDPDGNILAFCGK